MNVTTKQIPVLNFPNSVYSIRIGNRLKLVSKKEKTKISFIQKKIEKMV